MQLIPAKNRVLLVITSPREVYSTNRTILIVRQDGVTRVTLGYRHVTIIRKEIREIAQQTDMVDVFDVSEDECAALQEKHWLDIPF